MNDTVNVSAHVPVFLVLLVVVAPSFLWRVALVEIHLHCPCRSESSNIWTIVCLLWYVHCRPYLYVNTVPIVSFTDPIVVGVIVDGSGIAMVVGAGFFVVRLYSGSLLTCCVVPEVVALLIVVVLVALSLSSLLTVL